MYYSFENYSALYVIAGLAVFGLPMMCIFLAACRVLRDGSHSPKPAPQVRSPLASVPNLPAVVNQGRFVTITQVSKPLAPKVRRVRRFELAVRYNSAPTLGFYDGQDHNDR